MSSKMILGMAMSLGVTGYGIYRHDLAGVIMASAGTAVIAMGTTLTVTSLVLAESIVSGFDREYKMSAFSSKILSFL